MPPNQIYREQKNVDYPAMLGSNNSVVEQIKSSPTCQALDNVQQGIMRLNDCISKLQIHLKPILVETQYPQEDTDKAVPTRCLLVDRLEVYAEQLETASSNLERLIYQSQL